MTHFPPGVGFPKPFQTGAPQNFSEWLLIPLYKHLPAENKPTPPSHLIQFRNSPQTSRGLQTTGWQPQPSPLKPERTLQSINPPHSSFSPRYRVEEAEPQPWERLWKLPGAAAAETGANSSCLLITVTCCLMYAPPRRRCISLVSI